MESMQDRINIRVGLLVKYKGKRRVKLTETPMRVVLSVIQKGKWKARAGFRTHGLILDTNVFIVLPNYVARHAQQESLSLGCSAGKRSRQGMARQSFSTKERQAAKAIAVDVIAHSTVCKGKMVGGRSLHSYSSGGRGRRSNQRGKTIKWVGMDTGTHLLDRNLSWYQET